MDGGDPATPAASEQSLSKHDLMELKKQQKLEQRQQQSNAAVAEGKKKRTKTYAISAVLVIAALAGLWFWSTRGITGAVTVEIGDHPAAGAADAPVKIVVFGDFQCPFTRRFWQNAFPKILENYKDKISLAFWPVPTAKHNYDRASAEAAYCANEQGKFWEYAKLLFDRQGAATDAHLQEYARELGLDADAFWTCYASNKYEDKVQQDYVSGRGYGVVQTPTVAINGHLLSGDLPFEDYQTFIEFELGQR
jgi:protein-disulfide isomerase